MVEPRGDRGGITELNVLTRVFRIQRGEGRIVGLVVGCMFLTTAGFTIGESGISALFFERVGPDGLPVMYLAQGGVGIVAMLVLSGALGRFERRRAYVWMPVLLVTVVILERAVVAADPGWIYRVLYLTTAVAMLVQSVYLWGVAGIVTDTRRAKRLFPIFGAGNILGSVVGGLVTRPLASAIGAENLLVVWAIALVATSALCAAIVGVRPGRDGFRVHRRRTSAVGDLVQGFRFVRRSPLLVSMSIASMLFSVLYFSLYLPYAQAATARYPDPDALAGFFGIFWAATTAAAFLVSILLANRLLGWFGAAATILVLPVLYGGAFATLLATSTFATLVAIRFGVTLWLQGVSSPAWETLTNVTPEDRRDQTRAFLSGGPSQIGTAIAGVIALVGQDVLSARQLAMIGLVASLLTVVVAWMMRRSYASALVDAIRAGRPSVFDEPIRGAPVAIHREAEVVAAAVATLEDPDPRVRRIGTHVLASSDDERAVAALEEATRDEDAAVRAGAVEGLARIDALDADLARGAAGDPDPRVRLAALRGILIDDLTPRGLTDPDERVAATAAARLLGSAHRDAAIATLERLLAGETETRIVALRALATAPADDAIRLAAAHAADPSAAVRAAALETLALGGPSVAIPPTLAALGSGDPLDLDVAFRVVDAVGLDGFDDDVRRIVDERSALAIADGSLAGAIASDGNARALLHDALDSRARRHALVALSTASLTVPVRSGVRVALDVLRHGRGSELANALEVVEVTVGSGRARELLTLWEATERAPAPAGHAAAVDTAAADPDPFIRACAELVRADDAAGGGEVARALDTLSVMERVLVLRRLDLFAALEPVDLERVAEIAEERAFTDGAVLGVEGEIGDELHIVIRGTVAVTRHDGSTIARRGEGEVVGEMSLIRGSARVASLVAEGDIRTLRIGHREFAGMVRERPEIALAVMRVLADRLAAASTPANAAS